MVGTSSGSHAVAPGFQLGEYRLGQPLWPLRIADAYTAEGPKGAATIYVIHARIAAVPHVRDQIIAGTRAAAALPEHKHLVHTIAAGLTGEILWIATEAVDGSLVRDLLLKKRQSSSSGLGARATGNLVTGVSAALAELQHGALADESIAVNRTGRVRVIDLALASGTLAAMQAGLIPASSAVAPELTTGAPVTSAADVYSIGALLYEALVGQPLERGGPRPSDVVEGVNLQIDEVVARACHRDPAKRFGRVDVLGEVVAEALTKGGAVMTSMVPLLDQAPTLDQEASNVAPLPTAPSLSNSQIRLPPSMSLSEAIGTGADLAPSLSGNLAVDRVLAAALADSTEKWLISKGKLDYGPFSLADVVSQIEKGDIVAGNVIMDKDSGARTQVDKHPLLGPMVETARQKRDDARRAQAEVVVQSREKKRGVVLYGTIGLGIAAVAVAVFFIVTKARNAEKEEIAGVEKLEGASLKVSVSLPKKPPPPPKRAGGGGGKHSSGGGGGDFTKGSEDLALDMSDEGDEGSETLDMNTVYNVYSKYGGQLGGCLSKTGSRSANIYMNITGPTGKVGFVRVNGKQAGELYGCINGVLRKMKFPTINGPRTRAEFDIGL